MSFQVEVILAVSAAYILGSIPFGLILGRLFKQIDIRDHGSGNVGATNTFRILGAGYGIAAMILDMGKGMLAVFLAETIPGISDLLIILIGISAIFGHIFSLFLGFKGGKGVATSAGVFLYLMPIPSLVALAVFAVAVGLTKYVSLGSLMAAVVFWLAVLYQNITGSFDKIEYLVFVSLIVIFIFIRHSGNIRRLLTGTEKKISAKKEV